MGGFAWVTLATNDSYSLGALVLAHSLRRVGTKHDLAVLVTPGVTGAMREKLSAVFSLVQEVNVLDSKDEANLALLARPELGITFTKLHCWRLTQYEKCVFVDADTLVVRNCDELFERDEFSAAPDVGWPDCFNSGVFVFVPSQQTFASITAFAAAKGSFDGGDQGLLNQYFSDWSRKDISKHLPFIYNMCSTATYSYLPAFKQFGDDVRIIHFIGATKPWLQYFDTITGQVQPASDSNHLQPLLQLWWNIFCENVHPQLSPVMASSTLAPHWHDYNTDPSLFVDPRTLSYDSNDTRDLTYKNDNPDFTEFQDPWDHYVEKPVDIYPSNDHTSVVCSKNYCNIPSEINHGENERNFTESSRPSVCSFNSHNDKCQSVLESSGGDETNTNNERISHFHEVSSRSIPLRIHDDSRDSEAKVYRDEVKNISEITEQCRVHSFEEEKENFRNINHCQRTEEPLENKSSFSAENCQMNYKVSNNDNIRLEKKFSRGQTDGSTDVASLSQDPPCTNSKSVTTQSETNVTRPLEGNDNAGIAGALAKMTLGEARSPEQVAYEEHMRKQSWEQGLIDYMGRDSFDNIWKKISETLGVQPEQREPSPPKTESKTEKPKADTKVAAPTKSEPVAESKAAVLSEPQQKDEQDLIDELAREAKLVGSSSELKVGETVETPTPAGPPQVSPGDAAIATVASLSQVPEPTTPEKIESSSRSELAGSRSVPAEIPESPVSREKETPSTESASESQVPIQVAESVLEADVKESLTEDLKPVTEEAVSSISLSAQESVPAVMETAMEAPLPVIPTPNGSADHPSEIGNGIDAPLPSRFVSAQPRQEESNIVTPAQVQHSQCPVLPPETAHRRVELESSPVALNLSLQVRESQAPSSPEDRQPTIVAPSGISLPTTEAVEKSPDTCPMRKSSEQAEPVCARTQAAESCPKETQVGAPCKSEDSQATSETAEETPDSPAKILQIPATPTITEATPPTSPPLDGAQSLEEQQKAKCAPKKTVKKVVKKTSETKVPEGTDVDAEGKKVTKKVVKKVPRKKEEDAGPSESTGGAEKTKKSVPSKLVKKSVKTQPSLEIETGVLETPPPSGTSEPPVPPKRKLKTVTKKPETEP